MPNLLGRTDFNVGSDVSMQIINEQTGEKFIDSDFGALTDASASFNDKEITVEAMNNGGQPLHMDIPHGANGSVTFARQNGKMAKMLVAKISAWIDKGMNYTYTLQFQILNRDSSVDTYLMQGTTIGKGDLFKAKAAKEVDQSFSWRCARVRIT